MRIPLWAVAGVAAIWVGMLLWQIFGKHALTQSRDQKYLDQITATGEATTATTTELEIELEQAGLSISASPFNTLRMVGAVGGLLVGPALGLPLLVGIGLAVAAWYGPRWWVRERIRGRGLEIDKELPIALSRISALLPLVASMPQLLAMVADSLISINPRSPLAAELHHTAVGLRDQGLNALTNLESRAPSPALATLAFNLRVYLRSGGQQAALMADAARRLQRLIAGRNNARAKAAGAMTIAKMLPLLLIGVSAVTFQDPMIQQFYRSFLGQAIIISVAGMMAVGYQVMKRMVEDIA